MSVSLVAWGRWPVPDSDPPQRVTVPAPNTDPGSKYLWDLLVEWAPELGRVGFDLIQLPPVSKAQGGNGAGCDGFGINYRRDLGDFDWQGSVATRYGTAESLRRSVAALHAHGMKVRLDVPLHQLCGGQKAGVYEYPGADEQVGSGRGAMQPGNFRVPSGTQPQDPVASPGDDNGFGDELVYAHCAPPGYTEADALDWGDWLFRTTGGDEGRLDDGKGLWPLFVRRFMDAIGHKWIAEWFDGNPNNLAHYALSEPMAGRAAALDFNGHFAIAAACNGYTTWPLAHLEFGTRHPGLANEFVDNPDTDQNGTQSVISNKLLGYARLLTFPCLEVSVYGKDYIPASLWPGAYGLKLWIDNLVWIHQVLAWGAETIRWNDGHLFISERDGDGGALGQSAGLIVGINMDVAQPHGAWVPTPFGPNAHLHDYAGHGADLWTNADGWAYLEVPANTESRGQSYVCYSRAGLDRTLHHSPRRTTQRLYGATDLRRGPATRTPAIVEKVWVKAQTPVECRVAEGDVAVSLCDFVGRPVVGTMVPFDGWYSVVVQQVGLLPAGSFAVDVEYLGG